jgi:arylsulfatase A-like enzyme
MVEETMGIPLLVRGPGVPSGETCDHLVSNLDIPPTILRLCGLGGEARCHGRSLLDPDGQPPVAGRKGFMAQHYGLHEPIVQRAYYAETWKLVVQEDGFAELYDLKADPCEVRNLAMSPKHRTMLEAMRTGLQKVMEQTGDRGPRLTEILTGPPG